MCSTISRQMSLWSLDFFGQFGDSFVHLFVHNTQVLMLHNCHQKQEYFKTGSVLIGRLKEDNSPPVIGFKKIDEKVFPLIGGSRIRGHNLLVHGPFRIGQVYLLVIDYVRHNKKIDLTDSEWTMY